jgi:hypothetical protein
MMDEVTRAVDDGVAETDNEFDAAQARDEAVSVKAMLSEYTTARNFDSDARKQYGIDRSYASGRAGEAWASSANLIGSFIDILTSFLYAKDPDVSVLAAKNVGGSNADSSAFAETLGIVISRLWRKARLKRAARKMVRSSLSVGPGWLKVIMTHETRKDPIIMAELNDLEDNVARLQAKQLLIDEGDLEHDEIIVEQANLRTLQDSLTAKLEVVFRFGLGIDFVQAEDVQVSLDVNDYSDHLSANWNSNQIFVPTDELRSRFERLSAKDVKSAEVFFQRKQQKPEDPRVEVDLGFTAKETGRFTKNAPSGDGADEVTFARVIEIWDKRDNHIKTIVSGVKRWAVEPYAPPYASTRFYPYFLLPLFEVDGARHPQSLSGRLKKLQEEYSSKRSNARLTAERSVPGILFNSQGVTPEDLRKIEGSVAQELTGISPTTGDDIRKLFTEKPVAKMDPAVFNTASVLSDMERVAGIQEALSQSASGSKTATEAKIEQAGFTSRTGADRDTLEEVLQDLAEYTTELAIQALPADFVTRLAGPEAFWPEGMDVEDVLTLAEVEVKAGSTGKPDDESLRQSWSVLLPLVQQAMVAIQEAQATGNVPMAEALRNLIQETMRRLDERIDVEQFIPQGPLPSLLPAPGGDPAQGTGPAVTPEQAAADGNTLI